ncbi:MAG: regulatory protein GemA [Blastomonas fulva]|uniref:regulatory protein GemA n=1 Tax=Blastomonas fulva TaxID=1550728 RepID=UPI004034D5F9
MNSSKRHKLLQLGRKRLALSDEAYRDILKRCAGVDSAKHIENAGFAKVMDEFRRLGFVSFARARAFDRGDLSGKASAGQVNMIKSLWLECTGDGDEAALDTFIRNKFKIDALRFTDHSHAVKIISALRGWKASKQAKALREAHSAP